VTIVVGIEPGGGAAPALHLASLLARSAQEGLVLCTVVPSPWPPGPARVDAEYRAELEGAAAAALDEARAALPADVEAVTAVHSAHSVPAGLLEEAERRGARAVVVGPSTGAAAGRIPLGSVSRHLMHSSTLPLALAPQGYRCAPNVRVTRVTAAYGGTSESDELVAAAAKAAAEIGAAFRLASFAVRARPPYTSGVGSGPERALVKQWIDEVRAAAQSALARIRALPAVPPELDTVVGCGETWAEALEDVDWQEGEVLVVGSSSMGPVARVFLGSRASKILTHSPVPVIVVPRRAR
jgi:nucleotide-binding universal stress UspA family protein